MTKTSGIFMRAVRNAAVGAALIVAGSTLAYAEDKDVTVVILVDKEKDATADQALAGLKEIAGFVQQQPGLVSQNILRSKFPDSPPLFVHVMRWKAKTNWMSMYEDPKFLDLLAKEHAYFNIQPAEIFTDIE